MITLQQLGKTYSQKGGSQVLAVRDVNLEIARHEFVVITGRSGSGKTTLLNLIAGLSQPTSGRVLLDGSDLWQLKDVQQSKLRAQKMGFVFQFPSLMPALTVLENVVLPTVFVGPVHQREALARAEKLLDQVGLSGKLRSYPRHLSAGQQQRVVIARALMNQPELLLADEPTSNLDEQTEQEVMALFQTLHADTGITILMVTHVGQLIPRGTRALHMTNGLIDQDERIQDPNLLNKKGGAFIFATASQK